MKKFYLVSLLLIINLTISLSQVGINNPTPDPSAALDVSSLDKGVLVPRMDSSQRVAIVNPALGLLVFQTNGKKGFYYYDGSGWTPIISTSNQSPRYIGEYYGGGVIFHLWKDGNGVEHGLIVSPNYQSTFLPWGNITNSASGAVSSWDGLTNSNTIIAQSGHNWSAAQLCLDLVSGGQTDWYLPAIDQLSLLWNNRFHVNQTLATIPGADLLTLGVAYHWSSTEQSNTEGWIFTFYGYAYHPTKDSNCYVRAIRSF